MSERGLRVKDCCTQLKMRCKKHGKQPVFIVNCRGYCEKCYNEFENLVDKELEEYFRE